LLVVSCCFVADGKGYQVFCIEKSIIANHLVLKGVDNYEQYTAA
jgi:hypothetical protein